MSNHKKRILSSAIPNLKKLACITACAFLLPFVTFANTDTLKNSQVKFNRWAISVSGGYVVAATNDIIGNQSTNDGQNNFSTQVITGTLGGGIFNSLLASFEMKKDIGIEVGAFANWGSNIHTSSYYTSSVPQDEDKYMRVNSKGALVGFFIAKTFSKVRLAVHNDFVLGLSNQLYYNNHLVSPSGTNDSYWKYSGGMSYGWKGKIEASYNLTEHFGIGIEGFFMLHSWSPEKGFFESFIVNGEEKISSVSGSSRNVIFVDGYAYSTVSGGPANKQIRTVYPLHAAGGSLILRYSF